MKIKVKSFSELKKMIESLKEDDGAKNIVINQKDDKNNIIPVTIPVSNISIKMKLLLEGFDTIKKQEEFLSKVSNKIDEEEYGGFTPAVAPIENIKVPWVDRFIEDNFDGKRDGLKIVWNLPEGKFELDPWGLKLRKC